MALLDLATIEAFVLIAELRSFTHAADALGTTQSAISLKLKRLEATLGRSLLERTPRLVRLSAEGELFLPLAKEMLASNERAFSAPTETHRRLVLGMSDLVAGPEFPVLLAKLAAYDPNLLLEVKVGTSHNILQAYDAGEIDAAIVRKEGRRKDGELLFEDSYGWFASLSWQHDAQRPLRLLSLTDVCSVRALALKTLDQAGIASVDAFIGGGVATVAAAVTAGLGVAAMAHRVAPPGSKEVSAIAGLPLLPASQIMLHSIVSDQRTKETLRVLVAAFRAALPTSH